MDENNNAGLNNNADDNSGADSQPVEQNQDTTQSQDGLQVENTTETPSGWKEGNPLNQHPAWKEREETWKKRETSWQQEKTTLETQLKQFQSKQEAAQQSSSQNEQQNTDVFGSHPLLKGVDLKQVTLKDRYETPQEYFQDIMLNVANSLPYILNNLQQEVEAYNSKQDEEMRNSLEVIHQELGNDELMNAFLDDYSKFSKDGGKMSVTDYFQIYKGAVVPRIAQKQTTQAPVPVVNNGANKVSRPTNTSTNSRFTGIRDVIAKSIKS